MPAARLSHTDTALFALSLALGSATADLRAQEAAQRAHLPLDAGVRALGAATPIDLPELGGAPTQFDAAVLAPLPSLYLARELDAAGLLRTAELVAGLFASGAITAPLEPQVGRTLHDFWQARHHRLGEQERSHLFAQVFEGTGFEAGMRRVCLALVAMADNAGVEDLRESVGLEQAALSLADGLWPSISGMVAFAARDVIEALGVASRVLREKSLQAAFGVQDLWSLVATTQRAQGTSERSARDHVDRGRNGMVVLRWLAGAASHGARLDLADAQAESVISAAQRWLLASGEAAP
ncbi:MAG: hypothetical protein Tsb007_01170 [Rhizobacter sp.]